MDQSAIQVWKRVMGYLRPYWKWATVAFIGLVGGNILAVAVPAILRDVIDVGIEQGDSNFMLQAGLLVLLLGVIRGVMGFFSRFFGERLSHFISYDIRNALYNKVQNQSFTYQDNSQVGTLITRAISDVNEIQRYFAFGLIDGLNTTLLFIGVMTVMFANSPLLALVSLVPLIPLGMFSSRFVKQIHPRWKQVMDRQQQLSNILQENALGAQVVRVFAREDYEMKKFEKQNAKLFEEQLGFIQQWVSYLPASAFIAASTTALVLFVGGIMEQNNIGGVTVGLVVAFNAYVLLLAQPMRFLGFVILLTTQAVASGERVFEILDSPETIADKLNAKPIKQIQGHVEFKDVTFAYEERPVLQNINLKAEPDQVIGIVGATGSGKTSIINLLPRFYDVQSGQVLVDGQDVRDVELSSLRKQIGMVLQESLLFSATVHENIAYGNPDATREQVIEAAKAANAHDFIEEFPKGYETKVGERGVTLSGGQRQRVAIARALLIDPRILILDDATSSVDTQTEHLIQEALSRLMAGRTTFIIAQRLTSVLDADMILVLEDGEIVERGTHQSLIDMGGVYANIYTLQLEEQEKARMGDILSGELKLTEEEKHKTSEFKAIYSPKS